MQAAEGRQQWIASLGSSEIQSHAACSTNERVLHSTTPTSLLNQLLCEEQIVALDCLEEKTIGIGGSRGVPSAFPLRVQILLFRHTKFSKSNHLRSQSPTPYEVDAPPVGNPGSATDWCHHK